VGGQGSKGALWVVDLSYLSGLMFSPHAPHSNPIPGSGYKYLAYENYSHTLSIANGLLFLNTAGSLLGCQILDLMGDPMAPIKISSTGGNQRDCHDSFSRMVDGSQLLFSADGYSSQFRIHNITEIRTGKAPVLLGETAYLQGTYAHSLALTEDSKYMYTFDEFDNYDIAVYDISDVTNPVWKKTFQWKGEESEGNSVIHNGHVRGNFLLAAYYQAGFRIFDITDPINPVEVGNYETYRDPDGNGVFEGGSVSGNYQGAWNLYGGLASGKILVSDMNTGTFILNIPSDERPPPNPPGAPSDLIGSLSRCSESARSPMIIPTLKWNAPPQPATGISDAVTSYVISRSNVASDGPYTNIAEVSSAETTYIESAGLAPNTYYYTVTAKNSEAESNASPSVNITVYRTSCTIRRRRRRSRKPRRSRRPGSTSRTARIPELT
jgi:choice-of-anchor B domain-containing protein